MVERICPQCQYGNPIEHRFCGRCGASLNRNQLVSQEQQTSKSLTVPQVNLPVHLKQVGQAVAVSLLTLAAEAGIAWLRRRVEQMSLPSHTVTQQSIPVVQTYAVPQQTTALAQNNPQPANITSSSTSATDIYTVAQQRVVQVWEHGQLKGQILERTVWQREV